jgi:hypothetical protein
MKSLRLSSSLIILVALLMSMCSPLLAQDKTITFGDNNYSNERGTILLVPWDARMYLSDINKEVSNRTGLEIDEIKRLFREGFCQVFASEASDQWDVVDLLTEGDQGALDDLDYIHRSIGYDYSPLPPPPSEGSRFKKKWDKLMLSEPEDQTGRGTEVEEGEITSYYDEKERFMKVRIDNEELLPYLIEKYNFTYVVFVTELDIKVLRDHNVERGQLWERQIKVHYTILDAEGNEIMGTATYSEFGGDQKDIYAIIRKNFPDPVDQILSALQLRIEAVEQKKNASNFITRK